jgi:hypothetical protein
MSERRRKLVPSAAVNEQPIGQLTMQEVDILYATSLRYITIVVRGFYC